MGLKGCTRLKNWQMHPCQWHVGRITCSRIIRRRRTRRRKTTQHCSTQSELNHNWQPFQQNPHSTSLAEQCGMYKVINHFTSTECARNPDLRKIFSVNNVLHGNQGSQSWYKLITFTQAWHTYMYLIKCFRLERVLILDKWCKSFGQNWKKRIE